MARRSPHVDPVAEAALIGAVLLIPTAYYDVSDLVDASDFSDRRHRLCWEAIEALEANSQPYDIVTLAGELERRGKLDAIGGREFIESLIAAVGDVSAVTSYAQIVAQHAVLRKVAEAGRQIVEAAVAADADASETLEMAEQTIFSIGEGKTGHRYVTMEEAVPQMLADMAEGRTAKLLGVSTGFPTLDDMTAGFQPGQLIVVAARPGMGKSALALHMARRIAESTGDPVVFESYEMSVPELTTRILSTMTGIGLMNLRRGLIPSDAEHDIAQAVERMRQLPILMDDQPPQTISGLRSVLRRQARRTPLSAIFIDYLQLIAGSRTENRTQEIAEISRSLKLLARELEVPVIALSQLNRSLEARADKRPMLADLRDSGSVEQDADAVLFVYRDHYYNPAAEPDIAELIVAKQRNGPTGVVKLRWEGETTRFADLGRAGATPFGG